MGLVILKITCQQLISFQFVNIFTISNDTTFDQDLLGAIDKVVNTRQANWEMPCGLQKILRPSRIYWVQ